MPWLTTVPAQSVGNPNAALSFVPDAGWPEDHEIELFLDIACDSNGATPDSGDLTGWTLLETGIGGGALNVNRYHRTWNGAFPATFDFDVANDGSAVQAFMHCFDPEGQTVESITSDMAETTGETTGTIATPNLAHDPAGSSHAHLALFVCDSALGVSSPPGGTYSELATPFNANSLCSAVYGSESPTDPATASITFGGFEQMVAIGTLIALSGGGGGANTSPDTPTCAGAATGSTTASLTSSAFADDDADAHAASQWQVDENGGDFSAPVYDSGEELVDLESHGVSGLTASTTYIARVRHKDDSGDAGTEWSAWSAASASFTTDAPPAGGSAIAAIRHVINALGGI